ncbi:MAG: MEDS domain-containing protein [Candidatus Bathyarchaeota archaeon]|nr:MEDS domain-containing protein [Candidatus Bathyarchaeota archaeon]
MQTQKLVNRCEPDHSNKNDFGHFCNFYRNKEDLADILVPYFASGLAKNQLCIWVTSPFLGDAEAKSILQNAVSHFDEYAAKKQIRIISYDEYYLSNGRFDPNSILRKWRLEEQKALNRGFFGLRFNANNLWVKEDTWPLFVEYEKRLNQAIENSNSTFLCSYSSRACTCHHLSEILQNHSLILVTKNNPPKG